MAGGKNRAHEPPWDLPAPSAAHPPTAGPARRSPRGSGTLRTKVHRGSMTRTRPAGMRGAVLAVLPALLLFGCAQALSWSQKSTSGLAPGRRMHGTAVVGSFVYVFGGTTEEDGTSVLDDLWQFDTGTSAWASVRPQGVEPFYGNFSFRRTPVGRMSHAMAAVGTSIYVHGGVDGERLPRYDMWSLNTTASTPTWREEALAGAPSARQGHGMVAVGTKLWVFGGRDWHSQPLDVLYSLDTSAYRPAWVRGGDVGARPEPRFQHGMAAGAGGKVYVFGGIGLGSAIRVVPRLNDLFVLDTRASPPQWTKVAASSPPSGRNGFGFAAMGTGVWVFGGYDGTARRDQLFQINTAAPSPAWAQVSATGAPSACSGLMDGAVSVKGTLYAIGGLSAAGATLSEVWAIPVTCGSGSRGNVLHTGASPGCTTCGGGTYAAEDGASACLNCPAGNSSAGGGGVSCPTCGAGFSAGASASTCAQCGAGTYSPAAGSSFCSDCTAGSFSAAGASVCTLCEPGTISAANRSTSCTPCTPNTASTPGTYAPRPGMSRCLTILDLDKLRSTCEMYTTRQSMNAHTPTNTTQSPVREGQPHGMYGTQGGIEGPGKY